MLHEGRGVACNTGTKTYDFSDRVPFCMGNEIPVQVLNGEVTDELENWCAKRAEKGVIVHSRICVYQ